MDIYQKPQSPFAVTVIFPIHKAELHVTYEPIAAGHSGGWFIQHKQLDTGVVRTHAWTYLTADAVELVERQLDKDTPEHMRDVLRHLDEAETIAQMNADEWQRDGYDPMGEAR